MRDIVSSNLQETWLRSEFVLNNYSLDPQKLNPLSIQNHKEY